MAASLTTLLKPIRSGAALAAQSSRMMTIWYPDAKFERQFKVGFLNALIDLEAFILWQINRNPF